MRRFRVLVVAGANNARISSVLIAGNQNQNPLPKAFFFFKTVCTIIMLAKD
jgi:hypothetical protein